MSCPQCPHCLSQTSSGGAFPVYTAGSSTPWTWTVPGGTSGTVSISGTTSVPSGSYNSFAGVDAQLWFVPHGTMFETDNTKRALRTDHSMLGECQGVNYEEELSYRSDGSVLGREVKGHIVTTVFDRDPINQMFFTGHDIVLFFTNNNGATLKITISDIIIRGHSSGISVDDLMVDRVYKFTAKAVH